MFYIIYTHIHTRYLRRTIRNDSRTIDAWVDAVFATQNSICAYMEPLQIGLRKHLKSKHLLLLIDFCSKICKFY